MKFPKIPSGSEIFWIALIALIVAFAFVYMANTNDTVKNAVNGGWL